jgi:hypothetical protein
MNEDPHHESKCHHDGIGCILDRDLASLNKLSRGWVYYSSS